MNSNTVSMWDGKYGVADAKAIWGAEARLRLYDFAAKALPKEPAEILDVGCGLGLGALHLMELCDMWKVEGLDFSPVACEKSSVTSYCLDIRVDPLPKMYDHIIAVQTIEHMTEPALIVEKLIDKSRGLVVITVPYRGTTSEQHQTIFSEGSFFYLGGQAELLTHGEPKRTDMRVVFSK